MPLRAGGSSGLPYQAIGSIRRPVHERSLRVGNGSKVTGYPSPAVTTSRRRTCQGAQERGWLVRLRSARTCLRREILPGTGSLLLPFGARLRGACFGRVSRWVRTSEPGLGHARPAVRRLWGGEDRPSASKKPSWLWTSLVGVEQRKPVFIEGSVPDTQSTYTPQKGDSPM